MWKAFIPTRERIVLAAIEAIGELGVHRFTTRDVARRLEKSEATIFKHYKTKDDLLHAVLDHYCKFDDDLFRTLSVGPRPFRDALCLYVNAYMRLYENDPDLTAILQAYDTLLYMPMLSDRIKTLYRNRLDRLIDIARQAQLAGDLDTAVDVEWMAAVIAGYCREETLRWRMSGYAFALQECTERGVARLLDGWVHPR